MVRTFSETLHHIQDTVSRVREIDHNLSRDISHGMRNSLLKQRAMLVGKLKEASSILETMGQGTVIYATFRVVEEDQVYRQTFTNILPKDLEMILRLKYGKKNKTIEVLEIREVHTKDTIEKL